MKSSDPISYSTRYCAANGNASSFFFFFVIIWEVPEIFCGFELGSFGSETVETRPRPQVEAGF